MKAFELIYSMSVKMIKKYLFNTESFEFSKSVSVSRFFITSCLSLGPKLRIGVRIRLYPFINLPRTPCNIFISRQVFWPLL